jgi:hypothetical protein
MANRAECTRLIIVGGDGYAFTPMTPEIGPTDVVWQIVDGRGDSSESQSRPLFAGEA